MSTAQQIWLQKLGGANNPVLPSSDDTLKEDITETLKSLTVTNSSKNETKTEEKLTPGGLRPGERFTFHLLLIPIHICVILVWKVVLSLRFKSRFRKIKEEEARRKREEEKRKAEEVSGKEIRLTNESNKKETNVVERKTNVASGNGIPVVNINPSPTDETKEDTRMENIEQSVNGRVDGRDIHNSYEVTKNCNGTTRFFSFVLSFFLLIYQYLFCSLWSLLITFLSISQYSRIKQMNCTLLQ